ncbi:unnamed protein product [Prorocentrum cordatum]|uniref:Uncharacterized protein n=1 Tax=Prorocentrum cordatum TaxID=2364126 RepID=A0ABN9WA61_9DINO|nr:unnamed protein product [Polarella glacialis]
MAADVEGIHGDAARGGELGAGAAAGAQQGEDCDLGGGCGDGGGPAESWADVFCRPAAGPPEAVGGVAESRDVGAGGGAARVHLEAVGGIAVGPDTPVGGAAAGVEAETQAGGGEAEGGLLADLCAEDAARVADFLHALRGAGGAADASTVEALLRLLRSLRAPHAPRALLDALRREQPALFERLHASMRRTVQRTAAPAPGSGAATEASETRGRAAMADTPLLPTGPGC